MAAAAWMGPWLAPPFALCLVRAVVLPGRGLKVAVVGAVEVAASVLLAAALLPVF
ncbi:hypothetical protein [Streptomyces sp. NPDC093225]|uniref:hypothetical protein n=1 Tax=Streptomyces sp. NPDC093225 TaxID=3366034 RepID=UPI00380F68E0